MSALAGSSVSFDREHLPERFKLLNWGENETPDGPLVVNEQTFAAMGKQIAQDTFRRIVLDFEHQSLKGHPNFKEAPRHNAAHGDLELVDGDGIYISGLSWTPKGVEHGADFCDLSPVVVHTKRPSKGAPAVVLGILSAALCDNGAVKGISAFSATYQPPEAATMEDQARIIEGLQTELANVTKENQKLKEALEAMKQQLAAFSARLDEPPAVTAAAVDQVRVIAEAAVKPEALAEGKQQIAALSARLDALQKEHMIQVAVLQGKAVTLDETALSAMSADSLAQHIAGLGVTLPVMRRTPAGEKGAAGAETSGLCARQNALVAQVARETGCSDFQRNWAEACRRQPELFRI